MTGRVPSFDGFQCLDMQYPTPYYCKDIPDSQYTIIWWLQIGIAVHQTQGIFLTHHAHTDGIRKESKQELEIKRTITYAEADP
jgi:hypothetical protein